MLIRGLRGLTLQSERTTPIHGGSADCQTVRDPNPSDLYVSIAAVFLSNLRLDHVTFSDQPQAADARD